MRAFIGISLILLFLSSMTFEVNGFDFLIFAQQHPPGYCRSTFKQKCIESKMTDHFTIHGLWPSAKDETLQNCDNRKFDVKEVQPIRERLEEAWPSFRTNDPTVFWSHEWKKHGTCGHSSQDLMGVFKYFNTTLTLHDRYDLSKVLKKRGVTASTKTPYEIGQIRGSLSKEIGGNFEPHMQHKSESEVQLVCDKADGVDHPILTEVRFCLGEDLKVVDCPPKKERCGKDLIYFLPLKGSGSSGSRVTLTPVYAAALSLVTLYLSIIH